MTQATYLPARTGSARQGPQSGGAPGSAALLLARECIVKRVKHDRCLRLVQ
jgi:hypothetical protein